MSVDRVPLDPKRIENAKRRARTVMTAIRYHEKQAANERAKLDTLARTWGFSVAEIEDEGD